MKRLLIIGAGGHGRAVAEAAMLGRDYLPVAFLDDASHPPPHIWDIPVWGPSSALAGCRGGVDAVVVAIGRNDLRRDLHARVRAAGLPLATIVHPAAVISQRAAIGDGCALMAGSIVGTQARLGEGVIVNCAAVVDHDCAVGAFGHLGVNACMAGGSVLGEGAWIQAGSSLGYSVAVAAWQVLRPGESLSE
jgi:sugar O-acyltransferase (sialic acid O-acetyltransferase NeuD family)